MGASKSPELYRVIGSVAVVRHNKHERYLNKGALFKADTIDEANAQHLQRVGLIEPFTPEGDNK